MRRWLGAALLGVVACGGGAKSGPTHQGSVDPDKWPADDKSLCRSASPAETGGLDTTQMSLDVDEIAGMGSLRPNIRRVYRTVGEPSALRRELVCREVDSNLDGLKDVVRFYDLKGAPVSEKADRDFDGIIDVWIVFLDGKIAEVAEDTTKQAGKPNEWRLYTDGQLTRVRRDRNGDGKPDLWESYNAGKLERVGLDESGDGKVDRWDRDDVLRLEQEHAEARLAGDAGAAPSSPFPGSAGSESTRPEDAGAGDAGATKNPKKNR
jgi:hypothetical protein